MFSHTHTRTNLLTTVFPPKLARSKVEELNMSFEQYRKSLQAGVVEDEKDRVPLI